MDTLFPMNDSQGPWQFDGARDKPVVFLKELVLLENANPVKEMRKVSFHAGLNIVWADPKTEIAKKGGSKLSGHSAGKTTFCRILRWLLGESRFGRDELQQAVGGEFPAGWALLHVELAGTSWVIGRSFWDTSQHWAIPATSITEVLSEGIPQTHSTTDFFDELDSHTIQPLGHRTLPGLSEPLQWTDLLAWFARDQDAALQTVEAWRANTATISRNIAAKDSRHTIMRLVLGLLDEGEWREKNSSAEMEVEKAEETKKKPDLEASATASCDSLRFVMDAETKNLNGPLLLAKVQAKLDQLAETRGTIQARLADQNFQSIDEKFQDAANARAKQEQKIASLERGIKKLEKRIAERAAEAIRTKQREIEMGRGLPPGICGRHKDEVGDQCKFFQEGARPIGSPQTEADIAAQRDGFEDQKDEDIAELALTQNDLLFLQETEGEFKSSRDTALAERENLLAELAKHEVQIATTEHILKNAKSAEELRESNETKLRDLKAAIKRSNAIQTTIRSSPAQSSVRIDFSLFYQHLFRKLSDDDATASVTYDSDGLLKLSAKTREIISSSAVEALKVIAFDLAVMFWSARGNGYHPRFLIHDSPRVADMSAVPYAAIFELVCEAQEAAGITPNFQYIISTTEPPPQDLIKDHLILPLDASQRDERLFRRDF